MTHICHAAITATPVAPSLRDRIAVTVSSPDSSTCALEAAVARYVRRLHAAGTPPVGVLVSIRSACQPSIQRAFGGPNRAWAKVVLDRIVYCAIHTCYDAAGAAHAESS